MLYYLKKFQQGIRSEYSDLPNIILAGDKTTCFIIHVQEVEKYLNYNIDWSIPPSNAAKHNPNLVHEIANECTNINFIVFDINVLQKTLRLLLPDLCKKQFLPDTEVQKQIQCPLVQW